MAQALRASVALSSKLQRNSKHQINFRPFEVFNLKFLWSLELGIWNFKTHNGGVSKTVGIIFCALIFLAGCATPPPEEPVPLVWSSTGTAPKPFTAQKLQPIVSRPRTNVPAAIRSNPHPATIAKPAPATAVTWTSLNRWAAERKIAAPRFVSNSPVTTFAISSTSGVLVLAIGSRDATSNGTEIHLGFEPQFIDDQVFVHALDLQKNFAPLLLDPPLTVGT